MNERERERERDGRAAVAQACLYDTTLVFFCPRCDSRMPMHSCRKLDGSKVHRTGKEHKMRSRSEHESQHAHSRRCVLNRKRMSVLMTDFV